MIVDDWGLGTWTLGDERTGLMVWQVGPWWVQHKHGTMGGARGPTGRDPPVRRKPNSFHEFFEREWDA